MRILRMTLLITLALFGLVSISFGLASADRYPSKEPIKPNSLGVEPVDLVFQFSGVTDDGEQGSVNRKRATAVICTNISGDFASIEVRFYNWNRADVYTATVDLSANQTGAWGTQNTEIYFEDVHLDTRGINQGSGEILSTDQEIICNVQILDPLNNPPVFMETLTLYDENGSPVGDTRDVFLPAVKKNLPTN